MHSRATLLAAAGVCVVVFLSSSCTRNGDAEARAAAPDVPTVAVTKVTTADLSHDLVLTAEFKPYQEVDVMAKVAGYVKEIRVDIGDRVKEGELLATLEVPEMADDLRRDTAAVARSNADVRRAEDELARAQSAHEIAHLSLQRLSAVNEKRPGLIAQQEIDDARSRDLVSEAQVSAAKSAITSALQQVDVNKAEVSKIRTMMDYTRVTAPFAGVVTQRYADTGSMIQAGTSSQTQAKALVRLSQNSLLRLILPVPESAVPTVHIGQRVEVRVPTLNRTFPGTVKRFADKLSLATRTMDTEVDVENPTLLLIPGMYAEVNLTLQQRNKVLALPVSAIDIGTDAGQGHVLFVTPNGRVEQRNLRLGLETSNQIEVRSGLNEGDMVVLTGRNSLQPGQEVRPRLTVLADSSAGKPEAPKEK
jgi:RND family efflux transporter MFP subunit